MKKLVLALALSLPLMLAAPHAAEQRAKAADAAQCGQTRCTQGQKAECQKKCPQQPEVDCQKSCPKKPGARVV